MSRGELDKSMMQDKDNDVRVLQSAIISKNLKIKILF